MKWPKSYWKEDCLKWVDFIALMSQRASWVSSRCQNLLKLLTIIFFCLFVGILVILFHFWLRVIVWSFAFLFWFQKSCIIVQHVNVDFWFNVHLSVFVAWNCLLPETLPFWILTGLLERISIKSSRQFGLVIVWLVKHFLICVVFLGQGIFNLKDDSIICYFSLKLVTITSFRALLLRSLVVGALVAGRTWQVLRQLAVTHSLIIFPIIRWLRILLATHMLWVWSRTSQLFVVLTIIYEFAITFGSCSKNRSVNWVKFEKWEELSLPCLTRAVRLSDLSPTDGYRARLLVVAY